MMSPPIEGLVLPTVRSCVSTLGLITHVVVDVHGKKGIDVDDDGTFVTSTILPFPLSFRVGSCGSTLEVWLSALSSSR